MLRYRLHMESDDNGACLVTSPDLPIVTYGAEAEARRNAGDAITLVIESMMSAREDVPCPEELDGGSSHTVPLRSRRN